MHKGAIKVLLIITLNYLNTIQVLKNIWLSHNFPYYYIFDILFSINWFTSTAIDFTHDSS